MNSVFILIFNILASSQAVPQPDTHVHIHLPDEQSKGQAPVNGTLTSNSTKGKDPKTEGQAPENGTLTSNSTKGKDPKTEGQALENGTLTSNSTKGKDPKTGGGMVSNKCERKMPPGSDYGSMGGGVVTTHVHRKKPPGSDYGSKGYGVNCGRHRAPSCSRCGYETYQHGSEYCRGDCKWTNGYNGQYPYGTCSLRRKAYAENSPPYAYGGRRPLGEKLSDCQIVKDHEGGLWKLWGAIELHRLIVEDFDQLRKRKHEITSTIIDSKMSFGPTGTGDYDYHPYEQATPLFLSSVMENDQAALLLLSKGADPNKPAQQTFTDLDKDETVMYFTPLYELADRNREDSLSIAVVRSLLARGARQDLDIGGYARETPLERAKAMGNNEIVKLLEGTWVREAAQSGREMYHHKPGGNGRYGGYREYPRGSEPAPQINLRNVRGGGYGERKPGYGRYGGYREYPRGSEPAPQINWRGGGYGERKPGYGGGLDRTQSLFRLGYGGYGCGYYGNPCN